MAFGDTKISVEGILSLIICSDFLQCTFLGMRISIFSVLSVYVLCSLELSVLHSNAFIASWALKKVAFASPGAGRCL